MWDDVLRMLLLIALAAAAGYVLLIAYVYLFQSRLIYFPSMPGRMLSATPEDIGLAFDDVLITAADGAELHGWYVPAGTGAPAALLCHGNAGNISHRLEWLEILHDLGLAVLLFDYRGYGRSGGSPSEQGTYLDAAAAWQHLTGTKGLSPERIAIVGESLGGAIAAHLAKEVTPGALVLAWTFSSAPELASKFYWYLPVRLLARFQYPTGAYVAQVHAPTLVIHSRDDEIVPFAHGEALFARAGEPKNFLEIRGGHNAAFLMSTRQLTQGMRLFFEAHRILKT